MADMRRSGTIEFNVDGVRHDAIGSFTYSLGQPLREGLVGSDGVHGFKEMPQIPYIEGEVRDRRGLDVKAMQNLTDATVTLRLAVGKTVVLSGAWYANEGAIGTEDANIPVRFEGMGAEEI
jgi:hypothetical protein